MTERSTDGYRMAPVASTEFSSAPAAAELTRGEPCDVCGQEPPHDGGRLYNRADGYFGWACSDQHRCAERYSARGGRWSGRDSRPWVQRGRWCE